MEINQAKNKRVILGNMTLFYFLLGKTSVWPVAVQFGYQSHVGMSGNRTLLRHHLFPLITSTGNIRGQLAGTEKCPLLWCCIVGSLLCPSFSSIASFNSLFCFAQETSLNNMCFCCGQLHCHPQWHSVLPLHSFGLLIWPCSLFLYPEVPTKQDAEIFLAEKMF